MILGALMVVAPSSAGADEPYADTVTVCHRTKSVTNPYVEVVVSIDAGNGQLIAPGNASKDDHASHAGLAAFDFAADPDVAYPTPRNGEQWGDIIPRVEYAEGLWTTSVNWEAGQAIWEAGCTNPASPVESPTVIVDKVIDTEAPDEDEAFDFTVSFGEGDVDHDLEHGESFEQAVAVGQVSIVEDLSDDPDYTLSGVECSRTTADNQEVDLDVTVVDDAVTFAVGAQDIVECTFTNEPVVPEAKITISKAAVSGTTIPADVKFDFLDATDAVEPMFQLVVGGVHGPTSVEPEAAYTYLESPDATYPLDSVTCGELKFEDLEEPTESAQVQAAVVPTTSIEGVYVGTDLRGVTITPVDGDDVTCTFYNRGTMSIIIPDPDPVPASLEVVKVVDGDVPTGQWGFDFDLTGPSTDEDFELRRNDPRRSFTGLTAGTYTITETVPVGDLSILTDVTCLAGSTKLTLGGSGDVRTVTLAEAADVTCTFTNTYPEVQDTTVTVPPSTTPPSTTPPTTAAPSPTTAAPAAQPVEQVQGQTVVRSLPRTGSETRDLAGLGAALLAMGAALVFASKRSTSTISW